MAQLETPTGPYPQERLYRPRADYHVQWRAFAIRRNLALFLLFTALPACLAFFAAVSRHPLHRPLLFSAIVFAWLFAALAAVWWAGEFRCPRCQRRYASLGHGKGDSTLTRGLFDKVCANCKLTKFERVRSS